MNIMTKRGSEDNIVTYEHYCDTKADLANIPQDQISLGSVAIVLKDEDDSMGIYLANSNKEWISFSTGGGGNGGESSTDDSDSGSSEDRVVDRSVSVYLNSQITEIGMHAFAGCQNLTEVNCANVLSVGMSAFDYTYTRSQTFRNKLSIVNLPKCETVGDHAFRGCSMLTYLSIPECTLMSESAFYECSALTSVNLPKCRDIGESAFAYCVNLETVILSAIEALGRDAFYGCSKLESLYLLSSSMATSIGLYAFNHTKISSSGSGSIYVPASMYASYVQSGSPWYSYSKWITSMTDEKLAELRGEA